MRNLLAWYRWMIKKQYECFKNISDKDAITTRISCIRIVLWNIPKLRKFSCSERVENCNIDTDVDAGKF